MPLKWPGNHDRTAVLGRTGSGKTTAAAWHLSGQDFNKQPWLIANTKGDPLLNEIAQIEGIQTLDLDDTPDETGLYIVNPRPDEGVPLDAMFRRIWDKQNCGVYIDEGYMIEEQDAFNALLTQGRSRNIPMIVLSQRPAWISKFVFSEADFIQVFQLQHLGDRKNVAQFVPLDVDYRLPKYHSFWYNVSDNELARLSPVPDKSQILNTFRAKFPPPNPNEAPSNPGVPQKPVRLKRVV